MTPTTVSFFMPTPVSIILGLFIILIIAKNHNVIYIYISKFKNNILVISTSLSYLLCNYRFIGSGG